MSTLKKIKKITPEYALKSPLRNESRDKPLSFAKKRRFMDFLSCGYMVSRLLATVNSKILDELLVVFSPVENTVDIRSVAGA